METLLFALGVFTIPAALGGVVTYLFCRARRIAVGELLNAAKKDLKDVTLRFESIGAELQTALATKARAEQDAKRVPELEDRVANLGEENLQLKEQVASMKKELEVSEEMGHWLGRAEKHLRQSFQAFASRALETQTDEFLRHARHQLDNIFSQARGDWDHKETEFKKLVQPLERTLGTLDSQVRELEQKREGAYQRLQEQLWQLGQTQEQLQITTSSLVQALKTPGVRGTWGELQLRRVVEMAGMMEHVDFNGQEAKDGERPDMIVHLPNNGILPVDAKAPMQAYLEAMEASDDQVRKAKLDAHPRAMRQRIQELGKPRYLQQFEPTAEVVVMFVPNDACLGVAFERDPELLEYAIKQRVLLTTPLTLLGLLKAVAYGWQQHQFAENARQIASEGKQLYKCLSTFLNNLKDLGRHLDQAVQDYNKAVGSLENRVLPPARRLGEITLKIRALPSVPPVKHQAIPPPGGDLEEEVKDLSVSS
ncbi:MAG: DNA recombination protein RmuC [Candidatus Binatia bacterium]